MSCLPRPATVPSCLAHLVRPEGRVLRMARCTATWHIRVLDHMVAEGAMMFYGGAVGEVFGHDVKAGGQDCDGG